MRVFGWIFAVLIATPIVILLGFVVFNGIAIAFTQWRFNGHVVNQKIAEYVPDWSPSSTWIDATLAFPTRTSLEQLQQQLSTAGHDCQIEKNELVAKLSCKGFAGYVTWDCSHYQFITAEFGLEDTLRSVAAMRYVNCW